MITRRYGRHLRPAVDEATRERMWHRIAARGALRKAHVPPWQWGVLAGAALVGAVALMDARTARHAAESAVVPQPAGSAAPLAADVTLRQGLGTRHYSVLEGPLQHWRLEVGPATLTARRAELLVARTEGHLHVVVEQGEVDVESVHLPRGTAHLSAGMLIDIDDMDAPAPTASSLAAHDAPPPAGLARTQAPEWKTLAARGEHPAAYRVLGVGGVARAAKTASVGDLLALADVARLSGHPREAVDPLTRVLGDHASDARASLAAFTLGRVYLDDLGDAPDAARAFRRAVAMGLPGGLEEDAYARLVEARARGGDASGARAAYEEARARFPDGSRDAEMRRWVE